MLNFKNAIKKSSGKFSAMLALVFLLFFFQNCEEVSFESEVTGDISTSEEIYIDTVTHSERSEEIPAIAEQPRVVPERSEEIPAIAEQPRVVPNRASNSAQDLPVQTAKIATAEDLKGRNYRCELAGPGKSHHLVLSNSNLSSDTGMPRSICMTKYACENIVSKVYKVRAAVSAQQCLKNIAAVVQLSDFEIEKLVKQ